MRPALFGLFMLSAISLFSQTNDKTIQKTFEGAWQLVAVKSVAADSTVSYPYGEHPTGSMLLGADGYYSIQIYGEGRSKIVSGNKSNATPEENIMLVKKSNAHYGVYVVDVQKAVIAFKPESAFFPNWEGQELRQNYTLQNGVLTYTSGVSTFGASRSVVVWKKK